MSQLVPIGNAERAILFLRGTRDIARRKPSDESRVSRSCKTTNTMPASPFIGLLGFALIGSALMLVWWL